MKLRKAITVAAVLLIFLLSAVCVYAADEKAADAADVLYELGLFAGTGTNEDGTPIYSLDNSLTRQEAMTLFVNMLGKGKEAVEGSWTTPFTDVDDWAKPFIGYAYENGFTAGVAADRFGSKDPVTKDQYMTYLLLALGYEQGTDFTWNTAGVAAMDYGFNDVFVDGAVRRSHAVLWNCNALALPKKGSEACLLGTFENKPADAKYIAADGGFLFTWKEEKKAVVAYYGTDLALKDRYESAAVETIYEQAALQSYDIGDGRSFGYYYGLEGLFRIEDGRLKRLTNRPVAQMIFTRQGAVSSGPIILTFLSKEPVYSEYQLFGGDTIIEIKESEGGAEAVLLHGNTGHGIQIDKMWPMDSVVGFCAAENAGMGHLNEYHYALLFVTDQETGSRRPSIVVMNYTAGYPELEPDGAAQEKIKAEQERLNALGIGL